MIKNLLVVLLVGSISLAFASESASNTVTGGLKTHKKVYNSPRSGTNRYSNGNFGDPKITGTRGQRYYTRQQIAESARQAEIMGSTSFSSRLNKVELQGKRGQRYYTREELRRSQNPANRGSQAGSNQIFNYPSVPGRGASAAR
jgi:hypothetical protein